MREEQLTPTYSYPRRCESCSVVIFFLEQRELEKVFSLPIGDEEKGWMLPKNLKRLIGLGQML
jgi:hypothetical protein